MIEKLSHIASTIAGLLRDTRSDSEDERVLDDIREEMLGSIAPYVENQAVRPPVWAKVLYAEDIESLWYQRSDVMQILSEKEGEANAAETLERLTAMFRHHVPKAQFNSATRRR